MRADVGSLCTLVLHRLTPPEGFCPACLEVWLQLEPNSALLSVFKAACIDNGKKQLSQHSLSIDTPKRRIN